MSSSMSVAANGSSSPVYQRFDPSLHLMSCPIQPEVLKMHELGYGRTAYSDIAVTKPFPLFTPEAVRRIRGEIFNHETLENHIYSDSNSPCVIRGACPERARFTFEAWTHPAVLERLKIMSGITITPVFDYEIGHTNLQLGPRGWSGLKAEPDLPDSVGNLGDQEEIQPTLFVAPNWHKDSYPFVCILMLSESSHLQGGRTVIRKADGSNFFCPLPPIGHAMVLQGGNVEHHVEPTAGVQERISMVTSFRPIDPLVKDVCVLDTVRTVSDVPTLHKQWCQYRLRILAQRAEALVHRLDDGKFEVNIEEEMSKFVQEQGEFLTETVRQMTNPTDRVITNTRQTFLNWRANRGMHRAHL